MIIPVPRRAGRVRRPTPTPISLAVMSAMVGLGFAAPIAYLVIQVTGDGRLASMLTSDRAMGPLFTTLALAASVTVSAAALGTGLAWLIVRCDLPARRTFAALAALPLVLPSFVAAGALVDALGPSGLLTTLVEPIGLSTPDRPQGFGWAWCVLTLFTYPYVYLPVAARLHALPPSVEEAGTMLGRSKAQVFARLVLPQAGSAIGAGALLVFLYVVSEFGAVVLLRVDTLTRVIYANRLIDQELSLALSLLLGVVALSIVALERAVSRRGEVPIRRKGRPGLVALGRWRLPALASVAATMLVTLAVPCAVLVSWVARGVRATGRNSLSVDAGELFTESLNTAGASLAAAALAVIVVLPVALAVARHRSRVGEVAQSVITAGFALPGIVIAISLISWTLATDLGANLYQTFPLLISAYVVHFGAQAVRASHAAVATAPMRLVESARMLGASRLRCLGRIELPLMVPGLAAGAGLVMLSTMKELPVTLLLAPTGFTTLATRIWSRYEESFIPEAGVAALTLVALSGVLTWLLVVRNSRDLAG